MMPRLIAAGPVSLDASPAGRALDQLLRRIAEQTPTVGCGHNTRQVLALCAQHPATGPMCPPCHIRHVAGHDLVDEQRCDGCGDPTNPITGGAIPLTPQIWIGGIGWCDPCAADLQGLRRRGRG